ncbi:MAG: YARHG domain-containing protein [Lachnospiraceae bacterium]|nr:YARHG domain-containing protein [Lachnospiraceae bacterium]
MPYDEDFPLAGDYIIDDIAEDHCEFVFPEDNVFPIKASELEGKTAAECKIARNEIYARHGRMFNDEQLQDYFDTYSWYEGTTAPENFSDSVLNETEKANLQMISEYEARIQNRRIKNTSSDR